MGLTINQNQHSNLNIPFPSLSKLISDTYGYRQYNELGIQLYDKYTDTLNISAHVGCLTVKDSIAELFKRPKLMKILRKEKYYPYYYNTIKLDDYYSKNLPSDLINALTEFENAIAPMQEEKVVIESRINNLIFLYKDMTQTPIYEGKKKVYRLTKGHHKYRYTHTQMRVSGIRYIFTNFNPKVRKGKNDLYHIQERKLLKSHIDLNYISFEGGFIGSPILVFKCKASYTHKGKLYYLNIDTNQFTHKLTEARKMVLQYTNKLTPDYENKT